MVDDVGVSQQCRSGKDDKEVKQADHERAIAFSLESLAITGHQRRSWRIDSLVGAGSHLRTVDIGPADMSALRQNGALWPRSGQVNVRVG